MDEFEAFLKICQEKHENLNRRLEGMEEWVKSLDKKLNWFYVVSIATLLGVLIELLKG
jgi:hypothetical protein